MFGHKSFLRIGALSDSSIIGLYKDSYELESCNFGFFQGTDVNGKPQTEVRGVTISLRSEERRVGQECTSWLCSRRSPTP